MSRVASGGASGGPDDPGGPPTFAVGVGVGRPSSEGEGWSGIGCGKGVSDGDGESLRVTLTGPHEAMNKTITNAPVFTTRSLTTTWWCGPNFADAEIKKIRI
jgi:hypothetical protein